MSFSFTVDRKCWIRGNSNISCLLDTEGDKCVFGFLAKAFGAKDEQIIIALDPTEARSISWLPGIVERDECNKWKNSELTRSIIKINDNKTISDEERERHLKTEFAKLNINIKFIN